MSACSTVRYTPRAGAKPARERCVATGSTAGSCDADSYRKQARRLRQRYAGQPGLLHFSLCELARRHDRSNPAPRAVIPTAQARPLRPTIQRVQPRDNATGPDSSFARAVVDWFGAQVAGEFDGKILHQSKRQRLLKTAERLGISRFNANLVITVAQNRAEQGLVAPTTATATLTPDKRSSFPIIAMIAIVQFLIIWGAWHVLHV